MKNVFVAFTVHKDCGFANSASLLDFLERHQPEVIFLELPAYAFDWHYSLFYTRSSLESIAVRQYRENRVLLLVLEGTHRLLGGSLTSFAMSFL